MLGAGAGEVPGGAEAEAEGVLGAGAGVVQQTVQE